MNKRIVMKKLLFSFLIVFIFSSCAFIEGAAAPYAGLVVRHNRKNSVANRVKWADVMANLQDAAMADVQRECYACRIIAARGGVQDNGLIEVRCESFDTLFRFTQPHVCKKDNGVKIRLVIAFSPMDWHIEYDEDGGYYLVLRDSSYSLSNHVIGVYYLPS